ncbi:uncharacterized protein LOC143459995 isoform X2 [Clavelina lepadiformis]|uniref:uncharacterized protein LOC143459995 isoform X2 n=1 Tax=Clavelina lepadiformis TaxID=159417 RepID=UPI0040427B69
MSSENVQSHKTWLANVSTILAKQFFPGSLLQYSNYWPFAAWKSKGPNHVGMLIVSLLEAAYDKLGFSLQMLGGLLIKDLLFIRTIQRLQRRFFKFRKRPKKVFSQNYDGNSKNKKFSEDGKNNTNPKFGRRRKSPQVQGNRLVSSPTQLLYHMMREIPSSGQFSQAKKTTLQLFSHLKKTLMSRYYPVLRISPELNYISLSHPKKKRRTQRPFGPSKLIVQRHGTGDNGGMLSDEAYDACVSNNEESDAGQTIPRCHAFFEERAQMGDASAAILKPQQLPQTLNVTLEASMMQPPRYETHELFEDDIPIVVDDIIDEQPQQAADNASVISSVRCGVIHSSGGDAQVANKHRRPRTAAVEAVIAETNRRGFAIEYLRPQRIR